MRHSPMLLRPYAAPMLALTAASALMFAMATSGTAREGTDQASEPRQRAVVQDGIVVAGKLTSAIKGAAVGSRAGKSSSAESADGESERAGETANDHAVPAEQADDNGPFKVIIPGQTVEEISIQRRPQRAAAQPRPDTPATAADATQADRSPPREISASSDPAASLETPRSRAPVAATRSDSPVSTLVEIGSEQSSEAPDAGANAAATAALVPPAASDRSNVTAPAALVPAAGTTECMAGCYETTAARVQRPASARAAARTNPTGAPAASATTAPEPVIECVAGCDGIDTGKRPPMKRGAAAPPGTLEDRPNRITVMRGITRSTSYNVGQ